MFAIGLQALGKVDIYSEMGRQSLWGKCRNGMCVSGESLCSAILENGSVDSKPESSQLPG